MKRILYILTFCMAVSAASALPVPDNFMPQQRIENVSSGPSAAGAVGQIVFTAGNADATFSIYSITGQLIKVVRVSADQRATVEVPKGFYIVKCSNQWSRKVVVR